MNFIEAVKMSKCGVRCCLSGNNRYILIDHYNEICFVSETGEELSDFVTVFDVIGNWEESN